MSVWIQTLIESAVDAFQLVTCSLNMIQKKREKCIKNVTGILVGLSVLCFHRCPWYLECVVMCAWCKFHQYSRWVAEAELLFAFREWSNVGGELFLSPGVLLASRSVVFVTRWPPPLMISVKLAYLLEDPTVLVRMIGWPIGVTVNLTRSVQYPVKGGWSILVCL